MQSDRVLQNNHVAACVDFLRRTYPYRAAKLVFVVENLPGSRGGEIGHVVRDVADCVVMREYGKDARPGVPKDPVKTQTMGVRTRRLLQMDAVHFAHNMGTYPCDTAAEYEKARDAIRKQLVEQLMAFEIDEHGRWTGKNGPSGLDDLAVSFMMAYYWVETFFESPKYEAERSGGRAAAVF